MKRLSFAFLAALVTNASADNPTPCMMNDAAVLRELFNSTRGNEWTIGNEWTDSDPFCSFCDWAEVRCKNNRVTGLSLANGNLNGPIPTDIGLLSELKKLKLHNNRLTGNLPEEIGKLNKLTSSGPSALPSIV
eukprot:CAMPEP_0198265096 /NCGR_PEP_ID=MMETSP1447-20131203/20260_1 /TAXON_ID=420782 /ORGANISM="Chaetoceros dichaeta, Strain CCMP1751" /LENGTH=132 /DNA_ID=CAMNT_0043954381 /DNA_START=61 /DNA_END=456 /DNA_ORIENTATION=-